MAKPTGKTDKMERVASATLQLILEQGLSELTFSKLSRKAGVSRPWLYEYIGATKESLVEYAVDHFGKQYARLDNRPRASSAKEWLPQVLLRTDELLDDSLAYPWVIPLYYRYRGTVNPLGKRIKLLEERYLKSMTEEIKQALQVRNETARVLAETLMAVRLGLAYHWVFSDFRKHSRKEDLLAIVHSVLKRMLSRPRP